MRKLKPAFYLVIILVLLLGAFYGFSQFFSMNFFDYERDEGDKENVEVEGINLNNLDYSKLSGELILYLNGSDEPKIVKYKLTSGRQRLITNLTGSLLEYYFPGKVSVKEDEVYWVRYLENQDELVEFDTSKSEVKETTVFTSTEGARIVGTNIFSTDEIYLTQYLKNEDETYNYSIEKITDKTKTIYEEENAEAVKAVAGKDRGSKLVVQDYIEATNSLGTTCFLLNDLETELECTIIKGVNEVYKTLEADDQGFLMGELGFIDRVDSKGETTRLLEGSLDEHYESIFPTGEDVYFISGQIVYSHREEEVNYGSFDPFAIEKMSKDGSERTTIKTLPVSSTVEILEINEDYILLGISEKGSNKYEHKPTNIWILNLATDELSQLTEIECGINSYCEVVYLGKL